MTSPKRVRLKLSSLKRLIEELDGVRSILPSALDEDDEDLVEEPGQIESAEVEVALSSVVTTITAECALTEEPGSLSELFEVLFSPQDEIVLVAENLEESINGYFGELFGEDLDLADDYLSDLITILKGRRDKWEERKALQERLNLG